MDGMDDGMALPEAEAPGVNKLEEFEAKWSSELAEKKTSEDAEALSMKAKAASKLEEMKAERDLLRERNSSRNREREQALCEQIDADIEGSGNSWERIVKLVDLNGDKSDEAIDVGRMRQIFIKKKNDK